MKKIPLRLKNKTYPIYLSEDLQTHLPQVLGAHFSSPHWIVISNPVVEKLYGRLIRRSLQGLGKVSTVLIPEGERYKTLKTVEKIYQELSHLKVDRYTPLIALGGGVVGDVAGFAAATFLRGVPLIQIPTTLLAQVDSSVGGKTGVDLPAGKNLVGAFYQPHLVFIYPDFLKTLPKREILCGSAEVIKYGAIRSEALFGLLEERISSFLNLEPSLLREVIETCVRIKVEVVEKDEQERLGLRMILNFGHTLGHAIETLSGYRRWSHGEGVAMGMAFAAFLSHRLERTSARPVERITELLKKASLPFHPPPFPLKDYLEVMVHDKKVKGSKVQYVLLQKIGATLIETLSLSEIKGHLRQFIELRG